MLSGALVDLLFGIPPLNADLKKQGFENITSFYHYLLMNKGLPVNVSAIGSHLLSFIKFFSDANMALFLAVLFGLYALGIRRGRSMNDLMKTFGQAVAAISMILLLIGGGGAFSQVLNDGHLTDYIRTFASSFQMSPLLMAFVVAAILRLAIGSATVATLTAAPIMLPVAQQSGISPELMVLATGAGSVMFSHFNDTGFWMFKEYFNLSIKQTFMTWTVMECTIGIVGITTVLIMNIFM
jgi:H+/gluconate symporter-like permease